MITSRKLTKTAKRAKEKVTGAIAILEMLEKEARNRARDYGKKIDAQRVLKSALKTMGLATQAEVESLRARVEALESANDSQPEGNGTIETSSEVSA